MIINNDKYYITETTNCEIYDVICTLINESQITNNSYDGYIHTHMLSKEIAMRRYRKVNDQYNNL